MLYDWSECISIRTDSPVTANSIQDTTSWQEDRALAKLPEFLEKFSGGEENLKEPPKKKGSPHTLIVAGAGLRAADIVRYGRPPCTTVTQEQVKTNVVEQGCAEVLRQR